ncbi:MAG: HEAT repeat domain-containing protein, partial [Candidatus Latescibacteria bacterium]|nr:HEAT repeat domain-containing protein [Candidatus Latescibacterota bacterium]
MFKRYVSIALLASAVLSCSGGVDDLIQDLHSDSSVTRRHAAQRLTLQRGNHEAVEKLIALLDGDDERAKFIAIQVLGSLADSTAVDPLGRMLEHVSPDFRARVCWSLGTIGHDSGLKYIVDALDDPDSDVRYAATVALGHLHFLPAVDHIFPMLRDEVDSVRVRAIQSLYYYKGMKGAKIRASDLAYALNDPSDRVRYVAAQALGGAWEDAVGWIFPDSTLAGDLLMEALDDDNKFVRIEAINSLKQIRFKKSVPMLKKMYDT